MRKWGGVVGEMGEGGEGWEKGSCCLVSVGLWGGGGGGEWVTHPLLMTTPPILCYYYYVYNNTFPIMSFVVCWFVTVHYHFKYTELRGFLYSLLVCTVM